MRPIPGYSRYLATKDGHVWTTGLRPGFLAPTEDRAGYLRFSLIDDSGHRKGVYAHRAVAFTYLQNPRNYKEINHKDYNKHNNCVSNLEWCDRKTNMRHAVDGKRIPKRTGENGTNAKHPAALVRRLRDMFDSGGATQSELARKFNLPFSTVHVIVHRKQWRALP